MSESVGRAIDIIGQRFERWTVLSRSKRYKKNTTYWECRCDCGREAVVCGRSLRAGRSKSCGCLQKEVARVLINEPRVLRARIEELERDRDEAREALKPFSAMATEYDKVKESGECRNWIEFISDFSWPTEASCRAARAITGEKP